MRRKVSELTNEERIETLDALYTATSALKGREAMKGFLKDLLTESERIMLGRRILIAKALISGHTFDEIVDNYRVGKDTIQKISEWLDDQLPGYENAVEGLEKEFTKRRKTQEEKRRYATSALHRLKKKYPLHFLFFPGPKS